MNINIDKKKLKILIPVAALVLLLIIASIALFTRPNLEMDDINEPQKLSVLMKYGLPTNGITEDSWGYNDCIEFYGITLDRAEIDFESKEITFSLMDESNYEEAIDAIEFYADYERSAGSFKTYSYGDIEITTSSMFIWFKFY